MNIDKRLLAGEKVLSKVVARIVSADVPVSPVSRIDVSIAGGILRAAKESRSGILVLGTVPLREANFRTMLFDVSDKVCEESRQMIFLCRMTRPLNIVKNLFVLIPPMLEFQEGFVRALESVRNLASSNTLHMKIIAMSDTVRYIETRLAKTDLRVEVSYFRIDQWKELSSHLKKAGFGETDAVAILATRMGRLAWQPALKRFFHTMTAEYPENNIMMVYPADADPAGTAEIDRANENAEDHLLIMRNPVTLDRMSLEAATQRLLESEFSMDPGILAEIAKKLSFFDPILLSPGIVLFHTHSESVTKPVILLGTAHQGIVIPPLKQEARALFILISPKDRTNVHLQALAKVARMARDLKYPG